MLGFHVRFAIFNFLYLVSFSVGLRLVRLVQGDFVAAFGLSCSPRGWWEGLADCSRVLSHHSAPTGAVGCNLTTVVYCGFFQSRQETQCPLKTAEAHVEEPTT